MKNTIRTHHMQSDFSSDTDSIRNTPLEHILSQSRDLLGDVSRPNSQPRDLLGDVSRANFDKLLLQKDQLFHSVDIELWVVLALLVHIPKPLSVTVLQEPSHARYEVLQQDKHSLLTFCGMERNCSTRITCHIHYHSFKAHKTMLSRSPFCTSS